MGYIRRPESERMSHFSRTVPSELGSLNFYFNRIVIGEKVYFHVSTAKDNVVYWCVFHFRVGRWERIREESKCPGWMMSLETELARLIMEYLQ